MVLLHHIRRYSTRYNTWCYRQGFYRYDKVKKKEKYGPLICKYIDIPIMKNLLKNMELNGIAMKKNGL
jgi:hypothetical protein